MQIKDRPLPFMRCAYRAKGKRKWHPATIMDTGIVLVEDDGTEKPLGMRLRRPDGTEFRVTPGETEVTLDDHLADQ